MTFPTQTPPGELAPTSPRSEHTGARPAGPTPTAKAWEPGDPLHAPSSYRQGLFSFRFDGESWADAATWLADPADMVVDRHLSFDGDELADFIDGWHAWDDAGRPDVEVRPEVAPWLEAAAGRLREMRLFRLVSTCVRAAQEDEAAADRLRAALAEPPRRITLDDLDQVATRVVRG